MNVQEIIQNGASYFLPNLSIDTVVLTYHQGEIKCLLLRIGEKWLLPGGYIKRDEDVEQAFESIIKNRTGLDCVHHKFLKVFGKSDRKFGEVLEQFFVSKGVRFEADSWMNERFVSLAYYALVPYASTQPEISEFDEEYKWFSLSDLPPMWMDHMLITREALDKLRKDVQTEYNAHHLLGNRFTMPELHKLQELILGEQIDRSRFQKKMLSLDRFERLPKVKTQSAGRSPFEYKLKD